MADVEKININSTDYDIADARALRNKSTTASSSFVDTKAGTTPYPTTGSNLTGSTIIGGASYTSVNTNLSGVTIYGSGANVSNSYSTAVGSSSNAALYSAAFGTSSKASASYTMAAGYNARATAQNSVAVGSSSNASQNYTTALGSSASATNSYATATGASSSATAQYSSVYGYGSYAQANYGIAIGASAGINSSATDSIAIGNSAKVNSNCMRSVAIGKQATAAQSESVQLGQGTNTNYGSLQFRSWQVIDQSGKIPAERLPDGVQFTVDNMPTVPYDFYSSEDDSKQLAFLYKGETVKDENDDDVLVRDLCYRTKTSYSRPSFWCTWASSDYVPNGNKNIVYIDQEKLFLKLAEISRTNIDDDNFAGSYVGGDNSSQDMCFYYDGANQTWSVEFGSDSIETGTTTSPNMIEHITDLREYGIYITGELNLPEDSYEEIFDVEYYAPNFCDSFDYNDNLFTLDYMKFVDAMHDGDWGFGYATGSDDNWLYSDGTNTWDMPVLPKTYEFNDEEYEDVTIRFEWDDNESEWHQYINGDELQYTWSTQDLADRFGIYINAGDESDVGYIEMTWKPAKQIVWEQFDPVDTSHFCTAAEKTSMQGDINRLRHTSFQLIESATDLNTRTTSGAYWIKASGCTNLPSTSSISKDMFLFVTRTDATNVKQVLIADYVGKTYGGMNYGTYCSNMYVRTLSGGTWRSWEVILTPTDLMFLPSFDKTKNQIIGHSADYTTINWQEASGGGSYSEGSGIDITGNVISVDDLDCGTM